MGWNLWTAVYTYIDNQHNLNIILFNTKLGGMTMHLYVPTDMNSKRDTTKIPTQQSADAYFNIFFYWLLTKINYTKIIN